jgi:chitodextrinase
MHPRYPRVECNRGQLQPDQSFLGCIDRFGYSGLKGYNVYRNGSYLKQVLAPSTTTSDTGLVASTVYSYAVSAIDNAGNESAKSNTASTNTPACADTTAPSVPTGLTATAVASSQINLAWNTSTDTGGSGLAGYKVYRGGSQIGTAAGQVFRYRLTETRSTVTRWQL